MTDDRWQIEKTRRLLHEPVQVLIEESRGEGFRFLTRLIDEWQSGVNRFDGPGEALFSVAGRGALIGICGLNIDPYQSDPRVARLRHMYVIRSVRRRGLGRHLVRHVLAHAAHHAFARVRLRTDTPGAAMFYEALGFRRCPATASATHEITPQAGLGSTRIRSITSA